MSPWLFFAADDGYAEPLRVALRSLSATTENPVNAVVAVETPEAFTDLTRLPNVDVDLVPLRDTFASWRATIPHISATTYARLDVANYLPRGVDRVLYVDADVVFTGDVTDLFSLDLEGNLAAMATHQITGYLTYYNAGVALLDLRGAREAGVDLVAEARRLYDGGEKVNDQTILNAVFEGRTYTLPWVYNAQLAHWEFSEKFVNFKRFARLTGRSDVRVVHYIGKYKPWGPVNVIGAGLYREYATGSRDPEKVRKLMALFMRDRRENG